MVLLRLPAALVALCSLLLGAHCCCWVLLLYLGASMDVNARAGGQRALMRHLGGLNSTKNEGSSGGGRPAIEGLRVHYKRHPQCWMVWE